MICPLKLIAFEARPSNKEASTDYNCDPNCAWYNTIWGQRATVMIATGIWKLLDKS